MTGFLGGKSGFCWVFGEINLGFCSNFDLATLQITRIAAAPYHCAIYRPNVLVCPWYCRLSFEEEKPYDAWTVKSNVNIDFGHMTNKPFGSLRSWLFAAYMTKNMTDQHNRYMKELNWQSSGLVISTYYICLYSMFVLAPIVYIRS